MQIHIHVLEDAGLTNSTFVAVAAGADDLISKAGLGEGDTERAAVVQAVNAYYSRRADSEAAAKLPLVDPPRGKIMADQVAGRRPLATTRGGIEDLLRDAARAGNDVLIWGTKMDGKEYSRRLVCPRLVDAEHLHADDPLIRERRSFTLCNMRRVEVLSA